MTRIPKKIVKISYLSSLSTTTAQIHPYFSYNRTPIILDRCLTNTPLLGRGSDSHPGDHLAISQHGQACASLTAHRLSQLFETFNQVVREGLVPHVRGSRIDKFTRYTEFYAVLLKLHAKVRRVGWIFLRLADLRGAGVE